MPPTPGCAYLDLLGYSSGQDWSYGFCVNINLNLNFGKVWRWGWCVDVEENYASEGSGGGVRALTSKKIVFRKGLEVGFVR